MSFRADGADLRGRVVEALLEGSDRRTLSDSLGLTPAPAEAFRIDFTGEYQGATTLLRSTSMHLGEHRVSAQGVLDHTLPGSRTRLDLAFELPDLAAALAGVAEDATALLPAWDAWELTPVPLSAELSARRRGLRW